MTSARAKTGAVREETLSEQRLPPDVRERLSQLHDLTLFQGIPAAELLPLAEASETVHFEPDQYVVRQGEAGDSVFVITHGRIEVLARVERDGVTTESAAGGERHARAGRHRVSRTATGRGRAGGGGG